MGASVKKSGVYAAVAGMFVKAAGAYLGVLPSVMALPSGILRDFTITRAAPGVYATSATAENLKPTVGVVKQYWTDSVNGVNANAGTQAAPLLSVSTAIAKTDADILDIVMVPPPSRILWSTRGTSGVSPTKSVILRASDGGRIWISKHTLPVWTKDATYNFYSTPGATGAANTGPAIDLRPAVLNGTEELMLTAVASLVAMQTAPAGSYFHDTTAGMVYVRAHDDRNLVGDAYMQVQNSPAGNNAAANITVGATAGFTFWASQVTFVGGTPFSATNAQTAVGIRGKLVMDRVNFVGSGATASNGFSITGAYDYYSFYERLSWNYRDAENIHANASGTAHASYFYSTVLSRNGFSGTATDNATTGHEGCTALMMMCKYGGSDGRVVAFIDASRFVMYGGEVRPSARTDVASASVQIAGTGAAFLYEVNVLPAPGVPIVLDASSGGTMDCYGMDITSLAKSGVVNSNAMPA